MATVHVAGSGLAA